MKLHDLRPAEGEKPRRKRVGRGQGSGRGKSSGRGTKGQKSRNTVPPGFEGGRMPLWRQVPKWGGFTPRDRVEYTVVNVGRLDERFDAGAVVDPDGLRKAGLARKRAPVKVLARGEITKPLTVRANAFSSQAAEKIRAAGGTAEVV